MEKCMNNDNDSNGCITLLIYTFLYVVLGSMWGDYSIHYWLVYLGITKTIPYFAIIIASFFVGGFFWLLGIVTFFLSFVL